MPAKRLCEWCRDPLPKDHLRMRYCGPKCRQRASRWRRAQPAPELEPWEHEGLTEAARAVAFISSLHVPEGPRAGQPV